MHDACGFDLVSEMRVKNMGQFASNAFKLTLSCIKHPCASDDLAQRDLRVASTCVHLINCLNKTLIMAPKRYHFTSDYAFAKVRSCEFKAAASANKIKIQLQRISR